MKAWLVVLTLLVLGAALFYVFRPRETPPSIFLSMSKNGSVVLEGTRYVDMSALKARLERIKRDHPDAEFIVDVQAAHRQEMIEKARALVGRSRITAVGFITEPRPLPKN